VSQPRPSPSYLAQAGRTNTKAASVERVRTAPKTNSLHKIEVEEGRRGGSPRGTRASWMDGGRARQSSAWTDGGRARRSLVWMDGGRARRTAGVDERARATDGESRRGARDGRAHATESAAVRRVRRAAARGGLGVRARDARRGQAGARATDERTRRRVRRRGECDGEGSAACGSEGRAGRASARRWECGGGSACGGAQNRERSEREREGAGTRPGRFRASIFVGRIQADENRCSIFVGPTEADKNGCRIVVGMASAHVNNPYFRWLLGRRKYLPYFRGPADEHMPRPTKIPFIFVGDEADENTFRIFVGRPTKISGPTKFYAFPVVLLA
jgi:hypothetical protein